MVMGHLRGDRSRGEGDYDPDPGPAYVNVLALCLCASRAHGAFAVRSVTLDVTVDEGAYRSVVV